MNRSADTIHRIGTSQAAIAYTGTAGTSTAVGAQTHKVRVTVTTAAHIRIGSGSATTSDMYMPADRPEYFICTPGQTVSAVQVTAGGNLYVTELDN